MIQKNINKVSYFLLHLLILYLLIIGIYDIMYNLSQYTDYTKRLTEVVIWGYGYLLACLAAAKLTQFPKQLIYAPYLGAFIAIIAAILVTLYAQDSYNGFEEYKAKYLYTLAGVVWPAMSLVTYIVLPVLCIVLVFRWVSSGHADYHITSFAKWLFPWRLPVLFIVGISSATWITNGQTFIEAIKLLPTPPTSFAAVRNFTVLVTLLISVSLLYKYTAIGKKIAGFFGSIAIVLIQATAVIIAIYLGILVFIYVWKLVPQWRYVLNNRVFLIDVYNAFPFESTWYYIAIPVLILTFLLSRGRRGWWNPGDEWLPQNNLLGPPEALVTISKMSNAERNQEKQKTIELLTQAIRDLQKQKKHLEYLVKQWQTVRTMTDDEWTKWGDRRGSRRTEYSQHDVADFISFYHREIYQTDELIEEAQKLYSRVMNKASKSEDGFIPFQD